MMDFAKSPAVFLSAAHACPLAYVQITSPTGNEATRGLRHWRWAMSSRSRKSITNILSYCGCDHVSHANLYAVPGASLHDAATRAHKPEFPVISHPRGVLLLEDMLATRRLFALCQQ